ncbi:MAG TPA: YHYH protein [Candidatus Sulfotelmatobacter sp.]|nr:YHYH protein [Candidatus Sulfotelmatobacter sp.]
MKTAIALFSLTATLNALASDPQLTSWFTADSSQFAQIYRNNDAKNSDSAATTWSNGRNVQAQPAYCGVQEILSSSNWIYVRSSGLPGQIMGPWQNGYFPNLPTDQHFIYAIPRHPQIQTGNYFNPLGEIGMTVDGVRIFDATDAFSYSHANGRDAGPRARIGQGDRIWNRDALVNESRTFDAAYAHQQDRGTYHYHVEPIALRYLLGDHVDFDGTSKTYHESQSAPVKHSPILGWLQDGYPLYGPYGYSNPTNPTSGIRRMVSGFALRDGKNGTDGLAVNGRSTLPAWEVRERHLSSAQLADSQTGPDVNRTFPLGHFLEDYAYLGDCGKNQGRDFDLDELNGRWCVTPEFPRGTYAYFTTIDADGIPIYPYTMGRHYHGIPGGRLVRGIYEPVTTNFVNTANASLVSEAMPEKTKTMAWTATGYETK